MSPSITASSTPVTVTVCGTLQFAAVNVRLAAATVPSVVSLEATGITTSAVGWLFKTTTNDARPPASLVTRPEVGVIDGAVDGITARGDTEHDVVGDVAVLDRVVDAGHRDRLRHVPVGCLEREARDRDGALGGVAR